MANREALQALLESIPGVAKVYFQPPPNVSMEYPCIVYKRDNEDSEFADNSPYQLITRYQITIMDKNPDSEIPRNVATLPMCRFERFYTKNMLNHDVYQLYY